MHTADAGQSARNSSLAATAAGAHARAPRLRDRVPVERLPGAGALQPRDDGERAQEGGVAVELERDAPHELVPGAGHDEPLVRRADVARGQVQ